MMENPERPKSSRSRKRKRTQEDGEYDFESEVKKTKRNAKGSFKSRASLRHLKCLLKRSNFLANSLLTVITEQRKRHERKLNRILNKRRKKIKRVEGRIKKDYGKQCKAVPEAYNFFLQSEENQVKFGDATCFRVVVIMSHMVKKVNHTVSGLNPALMPHLSEQTINDTLKTFWKRIDQVLGPGYGSNALGNSSGPALVSDIDIDCDVNRFTHNGIASEIDIDDNCKLEVACVMNHILEAVSGKISDSKYDSAFNIMEKESSNDAVSKNHTSEVSSVIEYLLETVFGTISGCNGDSVISSTVTGLTSKIDSSINLNLSAGCSLDKNTVTGENLIHEAVGATSHILKALSDNVEEEVQMTVNVDAGYWVGHSNGCFNTSAPANHVDETPITIKSDILQTQRMGKCRRHIDMEPVSVILPAALEESRSIMDRILDNVCHEVDIIETKKNHDTCAEVLYDIINTLFQKENNTDSECVKIGFQQENTAFIHSSNNEIALPNDSTHEDISLCVSPDAMLENNPIAYVKDSLDSQTSQASVSCIKVSCPICCKMMNENSINDHLDICVTSGERKESLRMKSTARMGPKKHSNLLKRKKRTCSVDSSNESNQFCLKKLKLEKLDSASCTLKNSKSQMLGEHISDTNQKEELADVEEVSSASNKNARLPENYDTKEPSDEAATKLELTPKWKIVDPAPLVKNHDLERETLTLNDAIGFGEEEEEVIGESSSSESEPEVFIPSTELRRSTRSSRCLKSFKEHSEDEEEYREEEEEMQDDKKEKSKKTVKEKCEMGESLERLTKQKYSVGDIVKITWGQGEKSKLYKAKVLDRCPTDDNDWSYLVHYVGWTDTYDDWVFTSDVHSVVESNDEDVVLPHSTVQSYRGQELTFDEQTLLDEKFYMPGMNGKVAPKSLLKEVNGIRYFKDIPVSPAQPKLFAGGAIRDYQVIGYEWLKILMENGENGILADEMGLGKTIQCIAIVCKLVEVGCRGPFLVCTPMSTVQNWFLEFRRFAPRIPLLLYHGTIFERETLSLCMLQRDKKLKTRPVVITTYDVLMRDRMLLQAHYWSYMILDEGHRIKNLKCKLLSELKHIQSQGKLLLTGTPLQNNLSELWSLLNFLLPEVFDDLDTFETWFDMDRLKKDKNLLSMIHKILTPFLLRRMKCDVDLKLPPKKELTVQARLSSKQERLYKVLVNMSIKDLFKRKEYYKSTVGVADPDLIAAKRNSQELDSASALSEDSSKRLPRAAQGIPNVTSHESSIPHISMSNTIMQLRKCCNHPYLIEHPCDSVSGSTIIDEDLVESSGKLMVLDKLLLRLKERGHKVLLFSQMTKMLDILEDYCYLRGFRNVRIDGQMKRDARVESITNFTSNPDVFIFLLSTRAGGLGINLTAADTVVIYDSDWNPQNDAQAQDRCHRIGQERPVVVYRLVTTGTVDQQIVERASKKMALEKIIMHKALFKGNLEQELTDKNKINPEELLSLLEASKQPCGEPYIIGDVISEMELEKLLDRSDMIKSEC